MSGIDIPVTDAALDALDEYLASDRSPAKSMMLSDLDGFMTAIAIGPELIMPSEWMPVIWGGEAPLFEDKEEAQAVLGAIMSRFNEIVRTAEDRTFAPILWTTADGADIAGD